MNFIILCSMFYVIVFSLCLFIFVPQAIYDCSFDVEKVECSFKCDCDINNQLFIRPLSIDNQECDKNCDKIYEKCSSYNETYYLNCYIKSDEFNQLPPSGHEPPSGRCQHTSDIMIQEYTKCIKCNDSNCKCEKMCKVYGLLVLCTLFFIGDLLSFCIFLVTFAYNFKSALPHKEAPLQGKERTPTENDKLLAENIKDTKPFADKKVYNEKFEKDAYDPYWIGAINYQNGVSYNTYDEL